MDIDFDSYQPAYEVIDTIDEMQRQVRDSEERYQAISKGLIHNSDGTTSVSDEPECLLWIKKANKLARRISKGKLRQRIEWIACFVRRCCRSAAFRRIETNRVKLEGKDLRSCCQYMAEGFQLRSSLLVLRVDLYMKPTHKTHEDVRIAEKCMELYLRALSEDRIVPDVLRWIWKRECGFDRGVHYHLLVALDGHKHQNACSLSIKLGEAWLKRCGHLRSSYFNCWVRRHEYKYNAIGSVHISDWSMLMGIRDAIRYIVKGDGFVMTGHKRNLRRGKMQSSASQPKRGAPRKASHDMSVVYGILGDPNTTKPVDDQ